LLTVRLHPQEFHTILAALRYYQEQGQGEPSNRSDWIHDLATNGDEVISLNAEGIDQLCERLNLGSKEGTYRDFAFATACNRPLLSNPEAVLRIMSRFHFGWDTAVNVEPETDSDTKRLVITGNGWPGAWRVPDGADPECELDYEGEGRESFEQFLKEVSPYLAEPLTVHAIGSINSQFPLSACEWHVLPGSPGIQTRCFEYGQASMASAPPVQRDAALA